MNPILIGSISLPFLLSKEGSLSKKRRRKKTKEKEITIITDGKIKKYPTSPSHTLRIPVFVNADGTLMKVWIYPGVELKEPEKKQNEDWIKTYAQSTKGGGFGVMHFVLPHMATPSTTVNLDNILGSPALPLFLMNGLVYAPPTVIDLISSRNFSFHRLFENPFRDSGLEEHEHFRIYDYLKSDQMKPITVAKLLIDANR